MAYHVASTVPEPQPFRSTTYAGRFERVAAAQRPGPKGTCHAVDNATGSTVCGLDAATLEDFPDIAWPPESGDKCLFCRQWTPLDNSE